MPTYEYECEKCRKIFELFQSMRDEPITICPKELCRREKWGKGKVKRMLGTGAGLIFKGSGFYITDYRSEGYKAAEKKESGAGETKTDSKPVEAKPADGKSPPSKPAETKAADSKPVEKSKSASKKE